MTLTGQSGSQFSYNCGFNGIANASLPISNVDELTWLIETLECYGITKASDYPDAALTEMKDISISTGAVHPENTPNVTNMVTDCGQHTVIGSDSPDRGCGRTELSGDQVDWAWCRKCQGLAFAGNILPGACRPGPATTTPAAATTSSPSTPQPLPRAQLALVPQVPGAVVRRKPIAGPLPIRWAA